MADTFKILAQSNPAAATLTVLYTVPAATSTVVSTVVIASQALVATTYRLSVAIAAVADTAAQYLAYDVPLVANGQTALTLGITLAATDVIRVYTPSTLVSFNAFGVEIT